MLCWRNGPHTLDLISLMYHILVRMGRSKHVFWGGGGGRRGNDVSRCVMWLLQKFQFHFRKFDFSNFQSVCWLVCRFCSFGHNFLLRHGLHGQCLQCFYRRTCENNCLPLFPKKTWTSTFNAPIGELVKHGRRFLTCLSKEKKGYIWSFSLLFLSTNNQKVNF